MTIKTLYINKKLFKILIKRLIKSDNLGLLNFEVITITSTEILSKYEGMIAEKYY